MQVVWPHPAIGMPEFDVYLWLLTWASANVDPGRQWLWVKWRVPTAHVGDLHWVPGSCRRSPSTTTGGLFKWTWSWKLSRLPVRKESKSICQRDIYTLMLIIVLFTVSKRWNNLNAHQLMNGCEKLRTHTHTYIHI